VARPIAQDHGAKRAHILKSAAAVFADAGVARASMMQVAAGCGVSKATVYHYYASKDALLFDMLDSYLRSLRDRVLALPLDGLTAQGQLGMIVAEVLHAYEGMDAEHKIQTEGIGLLPQSQQEILRGYQRDMVAQMSGVIAACAPEVFGTDPRKLRATVMSVFGMLNWFYMWNAGADAAARREYAQLVTGLTLKGLNGV
jgi:AcrR family transcriptional regulator